MGKAGGWIAAAILLLAAIGAVYWGAVQRRRAEETEARLAAAADVAVKQALAEEQARNAQAPSDSPALEKRTEETAAGVAETPSTDNAAVLKAMMEALQTVQEGEDDQMNPFAAMFSGEQGKSMARMSAQMSLPMMYGGLFSELNLPPETESRVREILIDSIAEQISMGFDAMNGDADPGELQKSMEALGRKLRDDLATVLSADELAAFDAYEADKGRRMLESSLDMQLGMFANGLNEENRVMFRDVVIEEMSAGGDWMNAPENYTNPGAAIDRQMEAFRAARDRTAPVMDEDQAARVDAFVDLMSSMMETQRQFAESFMNRGHKE